MKKLAFVFALMLGTSIVRYRLFAVTVAVKKTAVYALVGTVLTVILAVFTKIIEKNTTVPCKKGQVFSTAVEAKFRDSNSHSVCCVLMLL